ncbi:hypothetical protein K2173_025805 [Erythroxylum novogranatense]|uniref:Zinc knuckle CX2CX4HX4C domain-containing protein n=1 Tax=Erythroxylum novogranatense TaxID=1862640 RepID=A0AAV8TW06_9ROSI|nr:hypothetical protein K2173_025805 [Erythroxylum novogranatense]
MGAVFPAKAGGRSRGRILTALGNLVGTTVKIDEETLQTHRGRYAHIAMDIDLTLPLKTSVELDGELLQVTYEGLPQLCYSRKKVGHSTVECPQHNRDTAQHPQLEEGRTTKASSSVAPTGGRLGLSTTDVQPIVNNGYGSWVYVHCKPRPTTQRLQQENPSTKSHLTSLGRSNESPHTINSRYATLTDTGLMEMVLKDCEVDVEKRLQQMEGVETIEAITRTREINDPLPTEPPDIVGESDIMDIMPLSGSNEEIALQTMNDEI